MPYGRLTSQPENPFSALIPDQTIAVIPSFTLESGVTLYNVPVAYSTRGKLSPEADNAMVICHALSGSADVSDWWGPLLGGPEKAFDVTRFFVVCINTLGSPYGTASPVTNMDGDPAKGRYGPEFPLTTIRDDVNLSKLLLDDLGVKKIAAVIGGSMGGMLVLEFAYLGEDYVRSIVPIATSARHSAWCISWGEAQRQSIYSDPKYEDGYYDFSDPPATGLGAARMSALLTYRSRDSFETRFGRNIPDANRKQNINGKPQRDLASPRNEHFEIHNEGHKNAGAARQSLDEDGRSLTDLSLLNGQEKHATSAVARRDVHVNDQDLPQNGDTGTTPSHTTPPSGTVIDPEIHGAKPLPMHTPLGSATNGVGDSSVPRKRATTYFSAQSYLRYQGDKFIQRFDANCYIAITRKLDTHDVGYHAPEGEPTSSSVDTALAMIKQPTLVLGIKSDGLFTFAEQEQIAYRVPNSRLERIESPEGHDAFLLQFEQVNSYILGFLNEVLPDIMAREPDLKLLANSKSAGYGEDGKAVKNSTFGEAEVEDITAW